jgi:hypothetical protein
VGRHARGVKCAARLQESKRCTANGGARRAQAAKRRTSDAELQTAIMHTKRKTADIKSGNPLACEEAALPMMFQGELESCADAGRQTDIMRTKRNAADIII